MIETVALTGSTNADLAARLASAERVAEGHWLVADRQEAGRGRLGRIWFDGLGNFMGSTVVHFGFGDPSPSTLALVAGLAVQRAVEPHVPAARLALLKWPNDVMVGNAKLAGMLLERVGDAVVVGIGVNLAAAPQLPDRATAALSDFGPAPDRDHFATALAALFDEELQRWRTYGLEPLLARWTAAAHPVGTALTVAEPGGGMISGTFAGLDGTGALLLGLPDGTRQSIHAGDVMLAGQG